ncbi:hypothetical protein KFK09_008588 [Dendrobium nobile]|uniref:Uncharacterized protein n=1 Tax=Dendrobium nobile TaxID=94219 RepID=A0A8T3BN65_DENNO|nr:hypothetical protein KFK09_008588 [Dendrobium nobile]
MMQIILVLFLYGLSVWKILFIKNVVDKESSSSPCRDGINGWEGIVDPLL